MYSAVISDDWLFLIQGSNLPNSGIKPAFPVAPTLAADSLPLSHLGSPTNKGIDKRLQNYTMATLETKKAGMDIFILD